MLEVAKTYIDYFGKDEGVQQFINDLMRGDPATFKAGYTKENAILAAADAFDMTASEVRQLLPTAADRLRDHQEFYGPTPRD